MSVVRKPLPITKINADAIVNSLGVNTKVYGMICTSIVNDAKSAELPLKIASWQDNAKVGDLYDTSGYALKAKHILHMVTPFYKYDPDMHQLEQAYRKLFLYAYDHKYYKLALPIIGTGANKYPHAYVLKLLINMSDAFCNIHPEMEIIISNPVKTLDEYSNDYDVKILEKKIEEYAKENSCEINNDLTYDANFFKEEKSYLFDLEESDICEIRSRDEKLLLKNKVSVPQRSVLEFLDEEDVGVLERGKRPVKFDCKKLSSMTIQHYLKKYIDTRYDSQNDRKEAFKLMKRNAVLDEEFANSFYSKLKGTKARITTTTQKLVRFALALHMSLEETEDLLRFCGKCFSPVDEFDTIVKQMIISKKYDKDIVNGFLWSNGFDHLYKDKKNK